MSSVNAVARYIGGRGPPDADPALWKAMKLPERFVLGGRIDSSAFNHYINRLLGLDALSAILIAPATGVSAVFTDLIETHFLEE